MQKALPNLEIQTVDVYIKYKEDINTRNKFEVTTCNIREKLIANSRRDKMNLKQLNYTPDLKQHNTIQVVFRYIDHKNDDKEIYELHTSIVVEVSSSTNHLNDKG